VAEIKIRYRGQFIGGKWVYTNPKIVELPIPFISRSEKSGEVICAPVGTFDYDSGMKLLELSGSNGPFVLESELPPEEIRISDVVEVYQPAPKTFQRPERTEHEELLIQRRINAARLARGHRRRKVRSDKGVPKPRKPIAADTPVQAQAVSEPTPQEAAG